MASPPRSSGIDGFGYALAIAGAVLFSTKGVFIKLAYAEGLTPDMVLALRMAVAVPVYLVIGALLLLRTPGLAAKSGARTVAAAAGVGVLGYFIASLLDFWGLAFVSAQYERLVLFTYPFFTLALGVFFFGEKMRWVVIPAMLVSYSGVLVLFGWNFVTEPEGLVQGTLLVLASGLAFALYQHLARGAMREIGSALFTCIAMLAAGVASLGFATALGGPAIWSNLSVSAWGYGLALGIVGTVLPSFLLNAAIGRIGPSTVSSMGNFGPVATIVMAIWILGEPFTLFHAIGTALVLAGAVWFGRAAAIRRLPMAAAPAAAPAPEA